MKRSKHERELMKQRQNFCEKHHTWHYTNKQNWGQYLIEMGRFFKNRITTFISRGCSCCRCSGNLIKRKKSDLNYKEQKKDFERE